MVEGTQDDIIRNLQEVGKVGLAVVQSLQSVRRSVAGSGGVSGLFLPLPPLGGVQPVCQLCQPAQHLAGLSAEPVPLDFDFTPSRLRPHAAVKGNLLGEAGRSAGAGPDLRVAQDELVERIGKRRDAGPQVLAFG